MLRKKWRSLYGYKGGRTISEIIIKKPITDTNGIKKENLFVAYNGEGEKLAYGFVSPFFDYDKQPEHPLNIYTDIRVIVDELDNEEEKRVKDKLVEKLKDRAYEIKKENNNISTRLYGCYLPDDKEKIQYLESKGFIHDEGMYILRYDLSKEIVQVDELKKIEIKQWDMKDERQLSRYIKLHNKFFSGARYNQLKIEEIRKLPNFINISAFDNGEVIGSINAYQEESDDGNKLAFIEDLFLLKDYRGNGIGKYLVYDILRQLKKRGFKEAQLELWSANVNAYKLYKSMGFEFLKETQVSVGINI